MITEQSKDCLLSVLKTPATGIGCSHTSFSIPAMPNIANYQLQRFSINESSDRVKVVVIV